MLKKSILAIASLIVLSGLGVLGSTANLINQMLSSISGKQQDIPSVHPINRPKKVTQTNRRSPTTGREIETPEYILWGVILTQPEKYEKLAEAARQRGKSDALWTDGFVRKTNLSLGNADIFKEKGAEYSKELLFVTERRREIGLLYQQARESRKTNPKDQALREKLLEQDFRLRKELADLQEKRKEIAIKYRDEFRKAIDDEEFKAFEIWLKTEFVKNFHSTRLSGKDHYKAKVASGEFRSTGKNIPEDHHK